MPRGKDDDDDDSDHDDDDDDGDNNNHDDNDDDDDNEDGSDHGDNIPRRDVVSAVVGRTVVEQPNLTFLSLSWHKRRCEESIFTARYHALHEDIVSAATYVRDVDSGVDDAHQ